MCLGELGHVLAVDGELATVQIGTVERTASLLMRPEAGVGDHVVVHTGFVVEVIGAEQAAEAAALRRGDVAGPSDQERISNQADRLGPSG